MLGVTDFSLSTLTEAPLITALFFILLLLVSIYFYRHTNPPLSRRVRIILASLRILAVIALFLALFEPVVSYNRNFERKPNLTILDDRSNSMEVVEDGKSRRQRVDSLMNTEKYKNFVKQFDERWLDFSDIPSDDIGDLNRDKTALGDVLIDLSHRQTGAPSDYWLLFSDGISNSGISPIDIASGLKTPIFSVGIGKAIDVRDVSIENIDYNNVVFAGKPTEIKVSLEWTGMNDNQARISVTAGDKNLGSETIKMPPGNLKDELTLKFVPEKLGRQTLKVSIPPIENEASEKNNSRQFSVLVLKSKLDILLVADKLDWEYSFLNRFLSRSESVDLTRVVFKKAGGYLTGQFPEQQEELNRFDLIILYDVNMDRLQSKAELFQSFLNNRGGGLLVILGENYLKSSRPGWIDQLLPATTYSRNAQPVYIRFNGQPAENFLFHPAVRISDSRRGIRSAWNSMPPFEMLIPLDSIAPNSEVLVTAGLGTANREFPILAYRSIGAGKVLELAAAPFWHWAFFGYGFNSDSREYNSLFDGIVSWLSLSEDSDPIKIIPDKNIYTRGEKIGFNGFVYDLGFRPIEAATGHITLVGENMTDTTVIQFIENKEGLYRAEIDILPPGRYNFRGLIEKDGRILKESHGQIAIEAFSIEEFRRKPEFGTLALISQRTGGEYFTLDNIDSLFATLRPGPIAVTQKNEITLWNKFWLLSIFILALGLEWTLRKRYQLI